MVSLVKPLPFPGAWLQAFFWGGLVTHNGNCLLFERLANFDLPVSVSLVYWFPIFPISHSHSGYAHGVLPVDE